MFMVFNKDKIKSYLISLGTVAFLFLLCFSLTNNDARILQTSGNAYISNEMAENSTNSTNQIVENNINNK